MTDDVEKVKHRMLMRAEDWLRKRCSPRSHMLLIVSATGAFGFLFSFLMLKMGITAMWLRYPLTTGLSYLAFLGLLRLWLGYQMSQVPPGGPGDHYSTGDAILDIADAGTNFGGLGSSGDGNVDHPLGVLDLEEVMFVVLAVAAISAGILVCLYVVWTGPAFLAEVLVDGLVMSGIYRRMKVPDQSYWMSGALRRTWIPAVLVAVSFAVAGLAMQMIAPNAHSIGQVVKHVAGKVLPDSRNPAY